MCRAYNDIVERDAVEALRVRDLGDRLETHGAGQPDRGRVGLIFRIFVTNSERRHARPVVWRVGNFLHCGLSVSVPHVSLARPVVRDSTRNVGMRTRGTRNGALKSDNMCCNMQIGYRHTQVCLQGKKTSFVLFFAHT